MKIRYISIPYPLFEGNELFNLEAIAFNCSILLNYII